jgi:TonB family protein
MQAARLMQRVGPVYQLNAQAAGIQGTVELAALIGKDGSVQSLQVLSSNTDPDLAEAAKDTVRQWRYSAAWF